MKKYKLRAEGLNDIFEFTTLFAQSMNKFAIHGCMHIPDVEFELHKLAPKRYNPRIPGDFERD